MDFPPALLALAQQQISQYGRLGAVRFYQSPAVSALAAGATSNPVQIRFAEPGLVLAIYGSELAGTDANQAQTGVRIQVGGVEDLFVDGQGGGAFLSLMAIAGKAQNWLPINRMVKPELPWAVSFKNNTAALTITPAITLAFVSLSGR